MGFLRQGYWSGLPFPSSGDLPDPGIKLESPVSPAFQVDTLLLSHLGNEGEKVFVDGEEIGRVMKIVYSYVNEINNGLNSID